MLLHKNVLQIFNNKKCKKNSCQGLRDVCRWIPIPCPQQPLHEPLGSSGLSHIHIQPNIFDFPTQRETFSEKGDATTMEADAALAQQPTLQGLNNFFLT